MMYLIYAAVAVLIAWSAYYLLRRLILFLRGRGGTDCSGSCGGCSLASQCRENREKDKKG